MAMYIAILQSCVIAWCFLFTALQTGVVKSAPQLTKHAMVSDEGWMSWKVFHGKKYLSEEEELVRYLVWVDNMHYIETHNKNADKHGYTLEINHFGDKTVDDWAGTQCHYLASYLTGTNDTKVLGQEVMYKPDSVKYIPKSMDWREHCVVTDVKNQDEYLCHSCYAFSAAGALESAHAIRTGELHSLSEQQIVDCSRGYGNSGCYGGNYHLSWRYLMDVGGLETETMYPYTSQERFCRFSKSHVAVPVKTMMYIEGGNENDLLSAVAFSGPAVVAIDHKHRAFQFYSSGVYAEPDCSPNVSDLSHELLVVGFGVSDQGIPYWIAKNSYGTSWGDEGYINIRRNQNMCGVATDAGIPII